VSLVRRESEMARELREEFWGGWRSGPWRDVVLSLSERCEMRRLQGRVKRVAVTGAFVIVAAEDGEWHVPMCDVLAIHRPHFEQVANSPRAA
jgi:hypothetical protein